jgi:hypothetical protein
MPGEFAFQPIDIEVQDQLAAAGALLAAVFFLVEEPVAL